MSGDIGEGGYSCPEAGCSCVYLLEKQLQNHVDTGSHFFGASDVIHTSRGKRYRKTGAWIPPDRRSSQQTVNDEILTEVAVCTFPESHEDIQINTPIPQSSNTSSMNTFIFGFALKSSGSKPKRSKKQFTFIRDWISHGYEKTNTKISPDIATQMMKLQGTQQGEEKFPYPFMKANANGKPHFKLIEQLTKYQLKSYTSKKVSELTDLLARAPDQVDNVDIEADEDD